MKRFKAQQIYLLFILILGSFLISGCGGDGDTTGHWFAPTATLMSIEVTPPNPSIAKGTTQQFMATGIYSNNSKVDMTASVNWTSSALVVATISNAAGSKGLATALSVGGPITIRATDPATGKTGTAALTVTAAALVSIGVTPINPTIARGTNQQFVATGIYTDATTQNLTSSVTWTSSAPTIATISNAAGLNGLATSLLVGITTITATSGAISGNTTLTVSAATLVSIAVTPVNRSIGLGTNQQFVATGTYTAGPTQDLTKSVTWTSSTPAVATISNAVGFNGLATSVAAGITTITATSGTISGATTLTVTPAALVSITVTPVNPSIALGVNQQFIATGIYANSTTQDLTSSVTWTSSAPAIATISNAAGSNGLATSLSAGITTITATFGAITGKTTLTVTTGVHSGHPGQSEYCPWNKTAVYRQGDVHRRHDKDFNFNRYLDILNPDGCDDQQCSGFQRTGHVVISGHNYDQSRIGSYFRQHNIDRNGGNTGIHSGHPGQSEYCRHDNSAVYRHGDFHSRTDTGSDVIRDLDLLSSGYCDDQ